MKPKDNSVRGDSSVSAMQFYLSQLISPIVLWNQVVTMLIWLGVVIMALAYLIDIAALSRDY